MQRPCCLGNPGRFDCQWLIASLLVSTVAAHGQVVMLAGPNGHVNIFNTDLAVLEAGETRKDLACTVTPSKPALGFDLRFHAGYDVTIPLKELAGGENSLNILFRVEQQNHPDAPHLLHAARPRAKASRTTPKVTRICRAVSIWVRATITSIG